MHPHQLGGSLILEYPKCPENSLPHKATHPFTELDEKCLTYIELRLLLWGPINRLLRISLFVITAH